MKEDIIAEILILRYRKELKEFEIKKAFDSVGNISGGTEG